MSTSSDPKDSTPQWSPTTTQVKNKSLLNEDKEPTPAKVDPIELLKEKRAQRLKQEESSEQDTHSRSFSSPLPEEDTSSEQNDEQENEASTDDVEKAEPSQVAPVTIIQKSSTGLWITIILLLTSFGLIGAAGYFYNDWKATLPEDPIVLVRERYNNTYKEHSELKLALLQFEQNKLNMRNIEREQQTLISAKERQSQLENQVATLKEDIIKVKKEMLHEFNTYKTAVQKQSRNLEINQLVTRSGKQYIDVKLTRCQPRSITFTHSEGATTVSTAELPDALLDRLGFTNPFQDIVNELQALEPKKENKAVQVQPKQAPKNLPIAPQSYDPPKGTPKVNSQPEKGTVEEIDFGGQIELPDELLLPAK